MSLILAQRRLIRPPGGPFAFPGTKPGFDPSHIAAANVQLSAVALGSGFVGLLRGSLAASGGGSPTAKILSGLGPAVNFTGATDGLKFTGQSTASVSACTLACIVQFANYNSGQYQVVIGNTTSGLLALGSDANHFVTLYAGGPTASTFVPSLNVPYFIACSAQNPSGSSMSFVVRNLANGVLFLQKTNFLTGINASAGTANIGNNNFIAQAANGAVAAVMHSSRFMSAEALLQWSDDPWSFWYPRQ